MAARSYPTKWQCHQCHEGPHLFAETTRCTNVVDNGITCAHKICDQCKIDKLTPSPLGIGAFEWEHEPQVLRATLEDRAQIPLSNQSTSDVVSDPSLVKSDRDVAVHYLPSVSIPAIPFDVSESPDVDLFGYEASSVNVSSGSVFIGKLHTRASICLIAERVASRFGTDRIDSSKRLILNDIGQNGVRTIGQIRIVFRPIYGHKWCDVPFQVVPDTFVRDRFENLRTFWKDNGTCETDE